MPRKQQFSSKQKKQQLQEKRKRKQNTPYKFGADSDEEEKKVGGDGERRLNTQPVGTAHERLNKYALVFGSEPKQEVERNKKLSMQPLPPVDEGLLQSLVEDFSVQSSELGMPRRGQWSYSMTKQKLELAEQKQFREWTAKLDEYYQEKGDVSYYERNLETWRQLWRTLEMSDIVLFVCDIRYPTLHFSYPVYKYITEELEKQVILVLNKVDMIHPSVSVSWKLYFEEKYPDIRVVLFSAFPEEQKLVENTSKGLLKRHTIKKPGWAYGADKLIQLAKCHYQDKIKEDTAAEEDASHKSGGPEEASKSDPAEEGSYVTIGLIGQPNAGKSSLVNGILQDKRVSVSKTPGHTKHFQTIFYSPDVRLCDCPGLVFPTTAPKQLQVLSGMFPVSQVKEPYSIVGYIAQRIDLIGLLRITHPNIEDEPDEPWSAWYICYAWAEKNGFKTARTGRSDVYRGANSILRLVVQGRICVRLAPHNYNPDALCGDYRDTLKELLSFVKNSDLENKKEEEELLEESSDESSEEETGDSVKGNNMFHLLQEED